MGGYGTLHDVRFEERLKIPSGSFGYWWAKCLSQGRNVTGVFLISQASEKLLAAVVGAQTIATLITVYGILLPAMVGDSPCSYGHVL